MRRRGFGTAVLLGDIFHYFIGDPKLETPLLTRTLAGLKEVSRAVFRCGTWKGTAIFSSPASKYAEPFASWALTDGLRVGAIALRLRPRRSREHGRPAVPVLAADLEEPRRSRNPEGDSRGRSRARSCRARRRGSTARTSGTRSGSRRPLCSPRAAPRAPRDTTRSSSATSTSRGRCRTAAPSRTSSPRGSRSESTPRSRADGTLSIVQEDTVERARRRGFGALEAGAGGPSAGA